MWGASPPLCLSTSGICSAAQATLAQRLRALRLVLGDLATRNAAIAREEDSAQDRESVRGDLMDLRPNSGWFCEWTFCLFSFFLAGSQSYMGRLLRPFLRTSLREGEFQPMFQLQLNDPGPTCVPLRSLTSMLARLVREPSCTQVANRKISRRKARCTAEA